MSAKELGAALLVPLIWGIQFVTTKVGVDSFPPLFFVALRFAGVAVLFLPFARGASRREILACAVISVFFGGLCFGLTFAGIHLGTAGIAAVMAQLMAPFTVLFAWPLLGEKPTGQVFFGLTIAFLGVALAMADPGAGVPVAAALLVLGGAAAQGLGNVLAKRLGPIPPMRLMAWLSIFTVPETLLASSLLETGQWQAVRQADLAAWGSLAYATLLGAGVGFALWFWLLGRLPMSRVAPFALLQTVVAMALGVVAMGDQVTLSLVLGALLCLSGVLLTQITLRRKGRAEA
ncbi:DMT family transporter [Martelella mediterranea]|uniref:Putative amino-acid metabolite efflux pump n=2 Tax=Martelella TaxID=293088 RepID=A0A1U9Z1P4_9HYPH|nr:EamA family transporter [Martelella mediterranea]AQZ51606.1 putative amino-acid metabolite efflux pump [Martelella mediterranea DSM 17316]